jgi:transposase, IS30 family
MGRTYRHLTLRERQMIFRMLGNNASMRQVAENLGKHISTIYRYVYDKAGRALDLYRHLPTGRWRRRRRYNRKPRGLHIPQANTVAYRPAVINDRQRLGDWECDLVQFRKEFGNTNLTTIVERKTRLLVIVRNLSRHSQGVMKGIKTKLGPYPVQARRSITFDRGSEFANYSYLKNEIGTEAYFCKPQAPWQKGTNENTNGRLRRFLPRETDLATVTDAQLQAIADKMNSTPRKCLGYIAPNEAFSRLLTVENAS